MSAQQKRKPIVRDFDQEADLQIKILEQKARVDFLDIFSQSEESTPKVEEIVEPQRDETETKVYIQSKARSVLEKWMYDHRLYCYPTKAEKQALALETGLSVQKISNWFINSRRRMLPKMLEHEGRNSVNFTISRKKKKAAAATITTATKAVAAPSASSTLMNNCFLSNYAVDEERKIIDQNSLFYGGDAEAYKTGFEHINHEDLIVSCNETDDELSRMSQLTIKEEPPFQAEKNIPNQVTRGILYDAETQSKCLFIIINAPK